ncbi:MAG: AI-2E family transporter [Pseudonocardiaceae bacterium]
MPVRARYATPSRCLHPEPQPPQFDQQAQLGGFVRAQSLVAIADAVLIRVGPALLGVPLALPLAVLVFIGGFLPYIGATVSGLVDVLG